MSIGKNTLSKEMYLDFFKIYVDEHCKRWAGTGLDTDSDILVKAVREAAPSNDRCNYLLYILWVFNNHKSFYEQNEMESYIASSLRVMYQMKFDLRYNDYNMHRFIEVIFKQFGIEEPPPIVPFENIYDEVMEFLYQFIICFKRHYNLPIAYDFRVNEF